MPEPAAHDESVTPPVLRPLVRFLRLHVPFCAMRAPHVEFLAKRLQSRYYPAGARIEAPAGLRIVKSGQVRVLAAQTNELGVGEVFAGNAIAARDSLCLELDREGVLGLCNRSEAFRSFVHALQRPE